MNRVWSLLLSCWIFVLAGCADEVATTPPTTSDGRWTCPVGWVAAAVGGCGPAVLLCGTGGAAAGACAGVDLSRSPSIALPDGGTVLGFRRLPDGGLGGGWPEPGDPDGPPDVDWVPDGVPPADLSPDAGIADCDEGWQRQTDGGCTPHLTGVCADDDNPLPGGACTHTGLADCPAGEFPDPGAEAVGMPSVHVRADADARSADGSAAHPYATITDAVTRAPAGAWVLVAAGEYHERVALGEGASRHVVGVCAARVVIRGPGPDGVGAETVSARGAGASLDLRDVTVTGSGRGGAVGGGATMRWTRVVAIDNRAHGVVAGGAGTTLALRDSAVRGTQPTDATPAARGITVQGGARVDARGVSVRQNVGGGVEARGAGTTVTLHGCRVQGQRTTVAGTGGFGLAVGNHASLSAERVVVEGNVGGVTASEGASLRIGGSLVRNSVGSGVAAMDDETRATLVGSVVQGTTGTGGHGFGVGVYATAGAHVSLAGVQLVENSAVSVAGDGGGTEVTLSGCVVQGDGVTSPGHGVEALGGARLHVDGSVFARNVEGSAIASDVGTQVTLDGCVVRDTAAYMGRASGVHAKDGAAVSIARSRVTGNRRAGVYAIGTQTEVTVQDSVVEETTPASADGYAHGLVAANGATLRATRMLVMANQYAGVGATDPDTHLELTDSVVRGTSLRPIDAGSPRGAAWGVLAQNRAALAATRVTLADHERVGLVVDGEGTDVTLRRSVVRGRVDRGADSLGVAVGNGAQVHASGVVIEDSASSGLFTYSPRTHVWLFESAIRRTRPSPSNAFGFGAQITSSSALSARAVLVQDAYEAGLVAFDASTRIDGADVLVTGVAPNGRYLGVGVFAIARGAIMLNRLAVTRVNGAALVAAPYREPTRLWDRSSVHIEDLYVRDVARNNVVLQRYDGRPDDFGTFVSWGLHAGADCTVEATRAVVVGADVGLLNHHGAVRVDNGLFSAVPTLGVNDDGTPSTATELNRVTPRGAVEQRAAQGDPKEIPLPLQSPRAIDT